MQKLEVSKLRAPLPPPPLQKSGYVAKWLRGYTPAGSRVATYQRV